MSGLLGRLADLAGRTLASARATPPTDPAAEQAAADATAPEIADLQPGGARDLGPAAGATRAGGPTPAGGLAPIPTPRPLAGHAGDPAATAPDAEAGPPAPAPRPQEHAGAPVRAAELPAGAAAAAPASGARPGLLRDVEIRVVAAAAADDAPAAPPAGDPRPELEERWRELGARLRAAHPPPGRSPARVPAENGAPSMRPEAPAGAPIAFAPRPIAVAPGAARSEAAQRPELVIRHLEIRIVAPAKAPAPVVARRPLDPQAGAWQAAARRYLRL